MHTYIHIYICHSVSLDEFTHVFGDQDGDNTDGMLKSILLNEKFLILEKLLLEIIQ